MPGADVEIDVDDLLPGAEGKTFLHEGDGQRGTQQGGAHVGMTVAIVPGGIVGVVTVGGNEFLEHALEVRDGAGLELDRGEATGGRGAEDGQGAVIQAGLLDQAAQLAGDVMDVGVAAGIQGKTAGFDGHILFLYFSEYTLQRSIYRNWFQV